MQCMLWLLPTARPTVNQHATCSFPCYHDNPPDLVVQQHLPSCTLSYAHCNGSANLSACPVPFIPLQCATALLYYLCAALPFPCILPHLRCFLVFYLLPCNGPPSSEHQGGALVAPAAASGKYRDGAANRHLQQGGAAAPCGYTQQLSSFRTFVESTGLPLRIGLCVWPARQCHFFLLGASLTAALPACIKVFPALMASSFMYIAALLLLLEGSVRGAVVASGRRPSLPSSYCA